MTPEELEDLVEERQEILDMWIKEQTDRVKYSGYGVARFDEGTYAGDLND